MVSTAILLGTFFTAFFGAVVVLYMGPGRRFGKETDSRREETVLVTYFKTAAVRGGGFALFMGKKHMLPRVRRIVAGGLMLFATYLAKAQRRLNYLVNIIGGKTITRTDHGISLYLKHIAVHKEGLNLGARESFEQLLD